MECRRHACHAGDLVEAEIDFGQLKSFTAARRRTKVWLRVRDMLDSRQMPPKDADQPTDDEASRIGRCFFAPEHQRGASEQRREDLLGTGIEAESGKLQHAAAGS